MAEPMKNQIQNYMNKNKGLKEGRKYRKITDTHNMLKPVLDKWLGTAK